MTLGHRCAGCDTYKPLAEFSTEASGKPRRQCRKCVLVRVRQRRNACRAALVAGHAGFVEEAQQFYLRPGVYPQQQEEATTEPPAGADIVCCDLGAGRALSL